MSNDAAPGGAAAAAGLTGTRTSRAAEAAGRGFVNFSLGLLILAALWWLGGYMI